MCINRRWKEIPTCKTRFDLSVLFWKMKMTNRMRWWIIFTKVINVVPKRRNLSSVLVQTTSRCCYLWVKRRLMSEPKGGNVYKWIHSSSYLVSTQCSCVILNKFPKQIQHICNHSLWLYCLQANWYTKQLKYKRFIFLTYLLFRLIYDEFLPLKHVI